MAPVTAVVKPGYSPPEQYEISSIRQGPWSDIYGFGATLYFAVAGALPVASEDRFDARVRTEAAVRARGAYRKDFLDAIDWAMELDPGARPQSIAEWRPKLLFPDADQTNRVQRTLKRLGTTIRRPRISPVHGISGAAAVIGVLALASLFSPCRLFGIGCRAQGPLELEIALPKRTYTVGDNLSFSLKSNRDCYFMVYTLGPTGEVERHDPAQNTIFMGSEQLKAAQWRQLPVNGYATVKAPVGTFELGAICSKAPLANIGLSDAQLREPTRGGRRSFSFALDKASGSVPRADVARATITYVVQP
jgi:serine/threonine protein kinase